MKLKDTIVLMNSSEYKDRFKAEYFQLKNRIDGLTVMLQKYKAGTLPFIPTCPYELLNTQLSCMSMYALNLETRAHLEEIDLK